MAAEHSRSPEAMLMLHEEASLIGVVRRTDGGFVEEIFASDDDADVIVSNDRIQSALNLAGAWSDLDWDEMSEGLDRIRHSSPPSPLLDE